MSLKECVFLLGVVLIIAIPIALTRTAPREEGRASATSVDWGSVRDDPSQRLTLSWMGSPAHPNAHEGTWPEKNLDQKFNVKFKPIFQDWNAYRRRRPLMLSSGEVPDVNWDGDPMYVRRNIHHGFVMEVPYDVILKYAPTYVKYLNRYGREAWLYSFYRGKNYGIPTFAACDVFPHVGVWRQDWLRKVGITKVPDTLDEMHEAFRRFRNDDPDGNGLKDTYGTCPVIHWSLTFVEVFCAYGVLPQDFIMRDGKVVWGGVQPEAKQALALLHKWYEEDLIDPDFAAGTDDTSVSYKKFQNGRNGYMYSGGDWRSLDLNNPNSMYSMMRELNRKVELAPCRPPLGVTGKRLKRVWGGPGHVIWFGKQVAKEPEKVIRVLRMFEAFATDKDLFVESRIGRRGLHWEWSPQRGLYPLPPYDQRGEDTRALLGFGMFENCYGIYSACSAPLEFTNEYLPAGNLEFRQKYCPPEWGFKNALGKSDVVDSAGEYLEDLRQFQMTAYVQIIRGDRPLDYFDEFVRLWRKRGGDILTREANEMLREAQGIYRKVGVADGGGRP